MNEFFTFGSVYCLLDKESYFKFLASAPKEYTIELYALITPFEYDVAILPSFIPTKPEVNGLIWILLSTIFKLLIFPFIKVLSTLSVVGFVVTSVIFVIFTLVKLSAI